MTALEQIRALYDYNEWANGHVLDAAAGLSEGEQSRELGASFGSVQGNLAHIMHAQAIWLSRWTGERFAEPPEPESGRAIEALRQSFGVSHEGLRRFVGTLDEDRLAQEFAYVDTQGNAQQRILWQALLHVANHSTHHRAETAMLLTALGKPPRQLDYIFFEIERAGGEPRLT